MRVGEREGESEGGWEGGREGWRVGGRERGTPPTKLFRLGRLFAGRFTNRTRLSNPGSPNLTSEQRGTPVFFAARSGERE